MQITRRFASRVCRTKVAHWVRRWKFRETSVQHQGRINSLPPSHPLTNPLPRTFSLGPETCLPPAAFCRTPERGHSREFAPLDPYLVPETRSPSACFMESVELLLFQELCPNLYSNHTTRESQTRTTNLLCINAGTLLKASHITTAVKTRQCARLSPSHTHTHTHTQKHTTTHSLPCTFHSQPLSLHLFQGVSTTAIRFVGEAWLYISRCFLVFFPPSCLSLLFSLHSLKTPSLHLT